SSPILISSSQPETIDDLLNTTEDEGDGQAFKYNFRRSLFSRFIQSFLVLVKNGCRTGSPSMKSWSSPCLFSRVQLAKTKSKPSCSNLITQLDKNSDSHMSSESRLAIMLPF